MRQKKNLTLQTKNIYTRKICFLNLTTIYTYFIMRGMETQSMTENTFIGITDSFLIGILI